MQNFEQMKNHPNLSSFRTNSIPLRKGVSQAGVARQLGISKSYLSMILSGQRKCPSELMQRLQAIPGVHKVNRQLWDMSYTQEVRGSNPLPPTIEYGEGQNSIDS
jgi:transcriptional regulator with XRE-family HTH domain